MFRASPRHPQTDLLSSAEQHLDPRRQKALNDPNSWANSFYREVFTQIDESLFAPLYDEQMGSPNAPVNQLVAMIILKDAMGLSDEQLFEACRFHLLYRQALGCVNISDPLPTESTYYKFRSRVEAYHRTHQVDLFERVFEQITSSQILRFSLSGKQVRMDSKLIGSNIAFYSRFELVHATLRVFYDSLSDQAKARMPAALAARMVQLAGEDAEGLVYRSNAEQIQDQLGELGRCARRLLACYSPADSTRYELLERVFNEQFVMQEDSEAGSQPDGPDRQEPVVVRPAEDMPADSVQSPYDPECSYRTKAGQQTKGYSVNLTETIHEDQLNVITDIQLEPAHWGDADFVKPALIHTQKRTGDPVDICYADGAYNRSIEHEQSDDLGHVQMVLSGIQGAPSRFALRQTGDEVTITDTQTGRVHQGVAVRRRDPQAPPKWRITCEDGTYRYFGAPEIRASEQRAKLAEAGYQQRTRLRNNVEASIYHLCHTLKGAKTVYRGLMRTKMWAWGRALWVNMKRIQRHLQETASRCPHYAR